MKRRVKAADLRVRAVRRKRRRRRIVILRVIRVRKARRRRSEIAVRIVIRRKRRRKSMNRMRRSRQNVKNKIISFIKEILPIKFLKLLKHQNRLLNHQ